VILSSSTHEEISSTIWLLLL